MTYSIKVLQETKRQIVVWGEIHISMVLYYLIFTYVTTPMQFNNVFEHVLKKPYIDEVLLTYSEMLPNCFRQC